MKAVFEEYGSSIVLVIVASMCLVMFANVWMGSGSFVSNLATAIFSQSTSDSKIVNTGDVKMTNEIQEASASKVENTIVNRDEPVLHATGMQNATGQSDARKNQLVINKSYKSTDLIWAVDADGKEIRTCINEVEHGHNDKNYYKDDDTAKGFFRVLSISQGNGNELISDCADPSAKSIAYANREYTDKNGGAGPSSYVANNQFNITAPFDDNPWVTYDITSQTWTFHKSGTYCFRVYVCDRKGKNMTGTVYINVAKRITKNDGDGHSAGSH